MYLGFGDGETYPFESDHGTQLNGTIVEGNTQRKKNEYMILNQCIVLQTSTPNVKAMNLPAHPFQQKITLTRPIILDTVMPRDTPPTGTLFKGNSL